MVARRAHDSHQVTAHILTDMNLAHLGLQRDHIVNRRRRLQVRQRLFALVLDQHLFFFRFIGITQPDLQQKPIHLGFGQRKSALQFDWILRG